jgi:hypothetical protein
VPLDTLEYPLTTGDAVRISFRFTTSGFARLPMSVSLTQTVGFGLRFRTPVGMRAIYDAIYQLRNFLTVAVGRPIRVLDVRGIIDADRVDAPAQRPRRSAHLELLWRFANVDAPRRTLRDDEMLFTRLQTQDRLGDIFNAWWAKEPRLRPVFDLYFGTITSRVVAEHVHFLMFAQALETYHRRTSNRTQLPRTEFRGRRKAIAESIGDDEVRAWLDRKLDFANELPLRERILEILEICPSASARIVGGEREVQKFVSLLVDTRNYRTHYTRTLEKKAARGLQLVRLTHQLRSLLETILLHELGFGCDEIVTMLERARRLEHLKNLHEEEVREE